jgi:hypothetical protein
MTLDPLASHPSSRSYVLKLHRDARPQEGLVFGRLESMASGRSFAFANSTELLRCLLLDCVPPLPTGAAARGDEVAR